MSGGLNRLVLSDLEQAKFSISESKAYFRFKKKIYKLMEFFDSLSTLITASGHVITCISSTKIHFLQTDLIDSTVKTLNNVEHCCIFGSFSDANALIRKFRDDLILFLYIVGVLKNRKCLSEEQVKEIVGDDMDVEKFTKIIELTLNIAIDGCTKNDEDKCVDAWFDDNVHSLSNQQRRKLSFENYMTYLKNNVFIDDVIKKYNLEKDWKNICKKLNDYTHNNGRTYTRHNLLSIDSPDIINCFDEIISRLEFITAFFMILLILIEPILIGSTNHIDYLDCNLTPQEDSQYQIASFVQDFIDEYINIS